MSKVRMLITVKEKVKMFKAAYTLSTSIWLARAAPAVGPKPETTFRTPSGSPAGLADQNHR
jgi:hypothetical protein